MDGPERCGQQGFVQQPRVKAVAREYFILRTENSRETCAELEARGVEQQPDWAYFGGSVFTKATLRLTQAAS